jgi:hypothetical protein
MPPPPEAHSGEYSITLTGVDGAEGDGGVLRASPTSPDALTLRLKLLAPTGTWTLGVEASGPVRVADMPADAGDGARVNLSVQTHSGAPVRVDVPLRVIARGGVGQVVLTFGAARLRLRFEAPTTGEALTLCDPAGIGPTACGDASVVAATTEIFDAGPNAVILSLPLAQGQYHVRDEFSVVVTVPANPGGPLRTLAVSADTHVVQLVESAPPPTTIPPDRAYQTVVRAQINAADAGSVTASLTADGRDAGTVSLSVRSVRALAAVRRVDFVGRVDGGNIDRVRVCSTLSQGVVNVRASRESLSADAAVNAGIFFSEVVLLAASGDECPVGYRSTGQLVWQGPDQVLWWRVLPGDAGADVYGPEQVIAMPNPRDP